MTAFSCLVWALYAVVATSGDDNQKLPNILFILADDLGWGNVGYHNTKNQEINTPNIDELVANGLELDRHYVYSGCAPSRASFQSGRLPVHVTIENDDGLTDPKHGIPTQMTGIASKLKEQGYITHLVGKWDCGFATFDRLPRQKGYDSFFGYLSKSITYFTKAADNDCGGVDFVDLWENDAPAAETLDDLDRDDYVEYLFAERVSELIVSHSENGDSSPFFIMYSMHLPHYPTELPKDKYVTFGDDEDVCMINNDYLWPGFTDGDEFQCRSAFQCQTNLMDEIIGNIVDVLKEQNMYDNTLIVFSSDNGGSLELDSTAANNWPLRGGKSSMFEGGIRVPAFVSGGYLPSSRRGQKEEGLMHIADWYTTFCSMAGADWNDDVALHAGLPNAEGLDFWPLIKGEVTESPRTEIPITDTTFISGRYKLLMQKQNWAIWGGWLFPNSSTTSQTELEDVTMVCSLLQPCLFDIYDDPSEYMDLAPANPEIVMAMKDRMQELSVDFWQTAEEGVYSCPGGIEDAACGCWMAENNWNYFTGPYQNLLPSQMNFEMDDDSEDDALFVNDQVLHNGHVKQTNYLLYGLVSVVAFVLVAVYWKYFTAIGGGKSTENELNTLQTSYGTI